MIVYIVVEYDYDIHNSLAGFLKKENAERYLKLLKKEKYMSYCIEEIEIEDAD